ncbi:MAG: hypothetical protein JWO22_2163, partial [Frankiales bacterium]|nr:hypothetical protein [Frankiales bacterium]
MPEARVIPLREAPAVEPAPAPAPPAAPGAWEQKLAGGLAFLRRRIT